MAKYFDLLTKKTKQQTEQADWALVLERTPDEHTLPDTIQLMSRIFPLSTEEARDLVASTPIVLLDQLTHEVADQLKKRFNTSHIECSITSDSFTKRKCFRAIWPESPNLAAVIKNFEAQNTQEEDLPESTMDLDQTEAPEIHPVPTESVEPSIIEESFPSATFNEQKELKQLVVDLQKENEELRKQFDRFKPTLREDEQRRWNIEIQKLQTDKNKIELKNKQLEAERQVLADQIKALEGRVERKLEHESSDHHAALNNLAELKKEFNRYRAVSEEEQREAHRNLAQLSQVRHELEASLKKTGEEKSELEERIRSLESQLQTVKASKETELVDLKDAFVRLQAEMVQFKNEKMGLVDRERRTQSELKQIHSEWTLSQKELEQAQAEIENLKLALAQAQTVEASKETELADLKDAFVRLQAEMVQLKNEKMSLIEAERRTQSELKQIRSEWTLTQKEFQQAQAEIEDLKLALAQAQTVEASKETELADLKDTFVRLQAEMVQLKNEKMSLIDAEQRVQSEFKQIRSEYTLTQKELEHAQAETEDLKRMLDQAQNASLLIKEEAQKIKFEAETQVRGLNADLEEWKKKAMDWSNNYANLVNEMERLRAQQSEEFESLKVRNRQLANQLDQAQRQNREFMEQIEQQEMIQRRLRAASEIAEKESRFRELNQKLESMTQELHSKEQLVKDITSEIISIEDEVIKLRQTQKYMNEQAKLKERSKNGKTKILNPGVVSDHPDSKT